MARRTVEEPLLQEVGRIVLGADGVVGAKSSHLQRCDEVLLVGTPHVDQPAECAFAANSASEFGGGIYNFISSSPTLTECNFCGNASDFGNRNIHGDAIDPASSGNLLLLNCNPGDVNFDFSVDSADLGYLLSRWGAISGLNADINQDGQVDGADLAFILGNFGNATDATTAP